MTLEFKIAQIDRMSQQVRHGETTDTLLHTLFCTQSKQNNDNTVK